MEINKAFLFLGLFPMLLAGCSTPSGEATSSNDQSILPISYSSSKQPYLIVDDVPDVASGKYIVSRLVYNIDKENKKLTAIDYESDYDKYIANQGTTVFEKAIQFVLYEGKNAIYFQNEGKEELIYKVNNSYTLASVSDNYVSHETISLFPSTFSLPKYGKYVSGKLTQDKVDGEGKRIPTGEGGYQKEDFYLFLIISETKAELYASDNATTHGETPLCSVTNYKRQYNASGILIKIPHTNGDYSCSLTRFSDTTMHFTNSYEKYGDYSGSGIFTLISND